MKVVEPALSPCDVMGSPQGEREAKQVLGTREMKRYMCVSVSVCMCQPFVKYEAIIE